jgi:hypothetical protein
VESTPEPTDIVTRLLGLLDHGLDVLHDKILRPIIMVGRFVAFGFILLICVFVVLIGLLVGATRLINVYAFPGKEWATYFLLGFIFLVGGGLCWRLRAPVKTRK